MKAAKTKLLAVLMAAVMVFATAPLVTDTAHAVNYHEITVDGVDYVVLFDSGTAYTNGCSTDLTSLVIRSEVTYEGVSYPVTRVCSRASFGSSHPLEYVWIPASITTIEYMAFDHCQAETIVFEPGSKLTSIAEDAFANCVNLKSIDLPSGITSIPSGALAHCYSLKDITIPDGVTSIGDYAMYDNPALWGATIPGSVTSIGANAFKYVNEGFTVHYTGTEDQWAAAVNPNWTNVNARVHCCPEPVIEKATPKADGVVEYRCTQDNWGMVVESISRPSSLNLSKATYTYNGSAKKPNVTVKDAKGDAIKSANYDVSYANNKNAGTATAKVTFKGERYAGSMSKTFKINKAANTFKPSGLTAMVKYSKVKNASQKLDRSKVIKFVKSGQGDKSYTKSSGNAKITISKTTGKVTVKKGLKKGTYKVKVKVKAAGNDNYKASDLKAVTFKVRVK